MPSSKFSIKFKKSATLLFPLLIAATTLHADGYNGNAPLLSGDSWTWLNLNLILFVVGMFVFVKVVKKLYELRLKYQYRNVPVAPKLATGKIGDPTYWYQCKNCRVTIRKDSPPKTADCFKAMDHLWTQLAEVGRVKYLCKNCNTLIETRTVPVDDNCPDAEFHNWHKLQELRK